MKKDDTIVLRFLEISHTIFLCIIPIMVLIIMRNLNNPTIVYVCAETIMGMFSCLGICDIMLHVMYNVFIKRENEKIKELENEKPSA